MAGTTTLKRTEWRGALKALTADHSGELVTIEVLDPAAVDDVSQPAVRIVEPDSTATLVVLYPP